MRTTLADLMSLLVAVPLAIFFGDLLARLWPGAPTFASFILAIPLIFAIAWPTRMFLRARFDPETAAARKRKAKKAVDGTVECPECQSLQTVQMRDQNDDLTDTVICNACDHHWSLTGNW